MSSRKSVDRWPICGHTGAAITLRNFVNLLQGRGSTVNTIPLLKILHDRRARGSAAATNTSMLNSINLWKAGEVEDDKVFVADEYWDELEYWAVRYVEECWLGDRTCRQEMRGVASCGVVGEHVAGAGLDCDVERENTAAGSGQVWEVRLLCFTHDFGFLKRL